MDINSLRIKYQTLKSEVLKKGEPIQKLDGSEHDMYPEQGDVFVKEHQLSTDDGKTLTYTGNVRSNSDGSIARVDIEESSGDSKSRFVYDKGSLGETLTKKTDTLKMKVDVSEEPGSAKKVRMEETNFVEAALNPEIDSRSEKLKSAVLEAASSVELLDNAENDKDKTPGVIKLEDALVFAANGSKRHFSGTVVKDKEGTGFEKIELLEKNGEAGETEFYFTKGSDFDYYKKTTPQTAESAQIFEKGGPKLVLFQEEMEFEL